VCNWSMPDIGSDCKVSIEVSQIRDLVTNNQQFVNLRTKKSWQTNMENWKGEKKHQNIFASAKKGWIVSVHKLHTSKMCEW
jgi:sialic acid synthase SpsE